MYQAQIEQFEIKSAASRSAATAGSLGRFDYATLQTLVRQGEKLRADAFAASVGSIGRGVRRLFGRAG